MFYALTSGIDLIEPGANFGSLLKRKKEERRKILNYFDSETFEYNLSQILLEGVKVKYSLPNDIDREVVLRFRNKYLPLIQLHRKLHRKIVTGIGIQDEHHKEFNTFYDAFIIAGSLLFDKCICVTDEKQLIQSFGSPQKVMMLR